MGPSVMVVMWLLCLWEERSQESWHVSVREEARRRAASVGLWLRVNSSCSSAGYGRAMDLALGAGMGSSPGLLMPVGVCFVTFNHIREPLSCAGFVGPSIAVTCTEQFSMCQQLCQVQRSLELSPTLSQSRCPIVKFRVVTAEGGRCWASFSPGGTHTASSSWWSPWHQSCLRTCLAGPVPGHVAGRLQAPLATGRLVGQKAVSLRLR